MLYMLLDPQANWMKDDNLSLSLLERKIHVFLSYDHQQHIFVIIIILTIIFYFLLLLFLLSTILLVLLILYRITIERVKRERERMDNVLVRIKLLFSLSPFAYVTSCFNAFRPPKKRKLFPSPVPFFHRYFA